jgi:3-hydroxyacyl-[acyl-carrier-protein] dehydratase
MLRNNFFDVIKQDAAAGTINALLSINKAHDIFKGHFPAQPVVPGVCMMQMVRELVELHVKRDLVIRQADNMKFLAIIDPNQYSQIEANVTYSEDNGKISLSASLFSGPITFFKLKATLESAG